MRVWRKGNPNTLLVGMQTGVASVENKWNFLIKLKMEVPFDPAIPLLGLYPKNPETPIQKNLCTPMFIEAQFTIAKYWKQPKCPSANEWIRKLWYIYKKLWYIYLMEFYTAERNKELIPFGTAWIELEYFMVSEIRLAVRNKYHMISPLNWNIINRRKK